MLKRSKHAVFYVVLAGVLLLSAGYGAAEEVNPSAAIAVGWQRLNTQSYTKSLILIRKAGTEQWQAVDSPNPPETNRDVKLNAASCANNSCVAIGWLSEQSFESAGRPLIYVSHNSGMKWNLVTPSVPVDSYFNTVTCTHNTCLLVGAEALEGQLKPLILRSTDAGDSWHTITNLPVLPADIANLVSLSCTDSQCVTVGSYDDPANNGARQFLILASQDAGQSWTLQSAPSPTPGYVNNTLYSVSCKPGTQHCVAVGKIQKSNWNGESHSVALYSDDGGQNWTQEKIAAPNHTSLTAVSCTNMAYCASAGTTTSSDQQSFTPALFLQTNMQPWRSIDLQNVLPKGAGLQSISCVANECAMSGFSGSENILAVSHNGGENWLLVTPHFATRPYQYGIKSVSVG